MTYLTSSDEESKFFTDYYEGKRVVLRVDLTGRVFIIAEDGCVIKKYIESGRFNVFLDYLHDEKIKVVSL